MLGEEDRICYLDHVHILAAFLKCSIIICAFLIFLFTEVLITVLLMEQLMVQLVRVFTLLRHLIVFLYLQLDLLVWLLL